MTIRQPSSIYFTGQLSANELYMKMTHYFYGGKLVEAKIYCDSLLRQFMPCHLTFERQVELVSFLVKKSFWPLSDEEPLNHLQLNHLIQQILALIMQAPLILKMNAALQALCHMTRLGSILQANDTSSYHASFLINLLKKHAEQNKAIFCIVELMPETIEALKWVLNEKHHFFKQDPLLLKLIAERIGPLPKKQIDESATKLAAVLHRI